MNESLHIKTIHYLNLPVKSRYLFLKHLQRKVHEFALNRQDEFLAIGATAEHFHKDKRSSAKANALLGEPEIIQNGGGFHINEHGVLSDHAHLAAEPLVQPKERIRSKKQPALIHGIEKNGCFALRAYTKSAIRTLDHYQKLLSEAFPAWTENCIESLETCTIKPNSQPFVYESNNWLPYRDCTLKNGVFYDKEKNRIANFDNRIQGNMGSFLRSVFPEGELNTEEIKKSVKILQLTPHKRTETALLIKDREIKKHAFRVQISIPYQLPHIFSLGQNAAFGNGVFQRIG